MSSIKTSDYKTFEISEESKGVISEIWYSPKRHIITLTLSEKYGKKNVIALFKIDNIEKSLKELRKKTKETTSSLTDSDFLKIEDCILKEMLKLGDGDEKGPDEKNKDDDDEPRPEISFEEWQKTLLEKYDILKEITLKNF